VRAGAIIHNLRALILVEDTVEAVSLLFGPMQDVWLLSLVLELNVSSVHHDLQKYK
jgi:hypothetical protein